jgi:folate-binding protein YgfZ
MVLDLQHFVAQNFIFNRGEVELLVLSGPDAPDFLNRLSTLNYKKSVETSMHGAFLNGQAKLISIFTSWISDSKVYFFIERELFQKTKEYLEKMHFSENLKIETERCFCIEARGELKDFKSEINVGAYNWGIPGKYFFSKNKFVLQGIDDLHYDSVRAKFGFPKPLKDFTFEHILIEGPFDNLLDRNKGCYPGQEVIEKIYTYGRVARKIKKIIFENADAQDIENLNNVLPKEVGFNGQNVGFLTSAYAFEKGFGIGTFKRHFYEKHHSFEITLPNNKILKGSVI